ncbi:MAG: thioredoxin family protein [Planctomycetales bacterium]
MPTGNSNVTPVTRNKVAPSRKSTVIPVTRNEVVPRISDTRAVTDTSSQQNYDPQPARPNLVNHESVGWSSNMTEAMKTAKKEGKDILMNFTGSDWCKWCVVLDRQVFSKNAFKGVVPDNFVLVEFDFPRSPQEIAKLGKETIAQNNSWNKRLRVTGYPTIFLASADGTPYAKTGYRKGSADDYVAHLTDLQNANHVSKAALAQAENATGSEKAQLLEKSILNPDILVDGRENIIDQIIGLDTDNALGLKKKYSRRRMRKQVSKEIRNIRMLAHNGEFDQAIVLIDGLANKYDFEGEEIQSIMAFKIDLLRQASRPKEALALAKNIVDQDPETGTAKNLQHVIAQLERELGN